VGVKFEEPEEHGGGAVIVGRCGLQFRAELLEMVFKCAGLFQLLHKSLEGDSGAWLSAEGLEQSFGGSLVGLKRDCG
jgi:hypothetical protein